MRHRRLVPLLLLLVPACGGGGGGTVTPVGLPLRLQADALDLGPATSEAELVVRLAGDSVERPVLLQVEVELPPALTLAAADRLLPAAGVLAVDGELLDDRLRVICGDAQNPNAVPLADGPVFRLRLVAANPRQPGTWSVRLVGLLAAAADGARLPVATDATVVPVTLR